MLKKFIIFIDALPYYVLNKFQIPNDFNIIPLRPNIGYSVNLQTELFTGKKPDEIGYFCEMTFDLNSAYRNYDFIFKHLLIFEKNYYSKRIIHKIIDKYGPYSHSANIPFKYMKYFVLNGYSVFDPRFQGTTPLHNPNCEVISYARFPKTKGRVDPRIILKVEDILLKERDKEILVMTQTELDSIGHWSGVYSDTYKTELKRLSKAIDSLCKKAFLLNKELQIFILSDHGMVSVNGFYGPDFEREIGEPSLKNYIYYLDGTIARFWIFNMDYFSKIFSLLSNYPGLHILTEEERVNAGLTSRSFGDIICVVQEGKMIKNNFWGPKLSRSMHGYHPSLESQLGIFATNLDIKHNIITAVEAFNIMFSEDNT